MDRRSLLALFLIALVFISTPYYFKLISPEQPVVTKEKEPSTTTVAESAKLSSLPKDDMSFQNVEEKIISVETPLYSADFSTLNGGSIKRYKLKDYLVTDSSAVNLIFQHNLNNLFISFVDINGAFSSLSGSWNTTETNHSLDVYDVPVTLGFYRTFGKETVFKTIEIDPRSYVINVVTDLTKIGDEISGSTYSLGWEGGLPPTETNLADDVSYFNGYVYQADDAYEFSKVAPRLKKSSSGELEEIRGATEWAAVKTKYFATVLLPKKGSDVCWGGQKQIQMGDVSVPLYSMAIGLEKDLVSTTSLYLGPLEYSLIKNVNPGIPSILNLGFSIIRPISKGVLWLLKSLHVWIPNYGIVLILFSVLVKILVYPLTKKSHQSSKEMQALQPEIALLKEKHKNNPQKLNQATMGLYKEHGVNPLGGCLPILLQMPLLFSLFQVFRSTIELRGAYFFGWITDLSAPDVVFTLPFSVPLYGDGVAILPLIMGITMYIQQKMMPTQSSGQQKFMAYFMTGFFVLLFNTFPSGLNLYYTLFNALTILQQKYLTPTAPKIAPRKKK